jgi:hypothetical protein
LGLTIDPRLDFSEHIHKVSRKLNSCIFILLRLSNFVNTQVLLTASYGCLYPHLSYGIAVWGAESSKTMTLFVLQKKAIRLIFGIKRNKSCRGVFYTNILITFSCLYIYECLSFLFKNKNLFQLRNNSRYDLWHSLTLTIPQHKTTFFEKHTFFNVVKLFNSLQNSIKAESIEARFNSKLRSFLESKEYYSVQEYLNDN